MHKSEESVGLSVSLPEGASLENLRKRAKTLLKERRAEVAGLPAGSMPRKVTLSGVQHELARSYGFASWPRLVAHFREETSGSRVGRVRREGGRVWIDGVSALKWGQNPDPTYIGAMDAAFCGSETPLDVTTMMGDSGLAFRLRWARGVSDERWCGSSPVGEWPLERETLGRATGKRFEWSFPDAEADKPVERIVSEIEAGRPILAYGKKLDVSVIYGYEAGGARVLLSDYWADREPFVMETSAICGVTAWLVEEVEPLARSEAFAAGLRLAVRRWGEGTEDEPYEPTTRFYYGPLAYEEWVADLRRADTLTEEQRENLYFLNGWNYSSLHVTRRDHAGAYLRANAECLAERVRRQVDAAASVYEEAGRYLSAWDPKDDRFGFAKGKPASGWTAEVRASEIEWLEGLAELDRRAMGHMRRAVSALDGDGSA
ncbi:MAG: hypothetical protein AAF750_10825 [Planctomycetota bacterium]